MADVTLFTGEQILSLIPQRKPMVMLDSFFNGNDTEAHTGLTVQADNLFCINGLFTEPGLIEHVAQSASALAGYKAYRRQTKAPVGFIGEVKKFRVFRLPAVGEQLRTAVHVLSEVLQISVVSAEVKSGDETIARGELKISIRI